MAFTLTYSDGQETDYDDDTSWEVDNGVLKMGRADGEWSVYVSPSHWAVLEVGRQRHDEDAEPKGKADDDGDDADAKANSKANAKDDADDAKDDTKDDAESKADKADGED